MWPALIGAGASLIGGLLNKSSADSARSAQMDMFNRQVDLQKEFAQHGVQWKVADAKAAGISPLAALGANTVSFAPTTIGSPVDTSLGDMARNMGQDLSRAVHATRSEDDRTKAVQDTADRLKLKNMDLQNQLLAAQIVKTSAPQVPPAMPLDKYLSSNPMPGQGDARPTVVPLPKSPPAREQINAFGSPWMSNPGFSPAQKVQDQYGDITEDIYGLTVKAPADVYYNWRYNFSPRLAKHLWKHRYDFMPFLSKPAY